jgi:8-oxo-dGTP pyrophosphatase MutT (NUDIX family)
MERQYPVPRITIPGGTMEDKDFQDFERCALREFKEETGIDISMCHEKVSREKIKKGFRFNHFTKYKKNKLKSFYHRNKYEFDTKYISMYYLVKID